jgi:hypothetical protein
MTDGASCHLVINNNIIGSKHKRTARDVLRKKALFRYMQTKYKWIDTTIQGIDWAGHKQAFSSWTPPTKPDQITTNFSPQVPARMVCDRKYGCKT